MRVPADPRREPKNEQGQLYYHLARVALGLQPILDRVSLSTVQVLTMVSLYDGMAIRKDDLEEARKTLSLAAVIATRNEEQRRRSRD